jgi:hypothetical protein
MTEHELNQRDKALILYVVTMTRHNDGRRMSNTLRSKFTPEERREIKKLTEEYVRLGKSRSLAPKTHRNMRVPDGSVESIIPR